MGNIRFKDNKILFVDNKIAMHDNCCCGETPWYCDNDCMEEDLSDPPVITVVVSNSTFLGTGDCGCIEWNGSPTLDGVYVLTERGPPNPCNWKTFPDSIVKGGGICAVGGDCQNPPAEDVEFFAKVSIAYLEANCVGGYPFCITFHIAAFDSGTHCLQGLGCKSCRACIVTQAVVFLSGTCPNYSGSNHSDTGAWSTIGDVTLTIS